ncbi:hypothetical protein BGZ98_006200 [Dissophora globulifera]|nr:hypothetical protein BGZ98_006200 [Dissophora globulifera]
MVLASELPIPDECIDLILAYLVDERHALHALVCSSQKLLERTAPILYRSPFHLIEHERRWSKEEKERRCTALLALLLTSATAVSTSSPSSLSSTLVCTTPPPIVSHRFRPPRLPTIDYLRFFTLQCHVDLWRPLVNLRATVSADNNYVVDNSKSMLDLVNEVAAALIQYRPEDIRVIGQPIARAPAVLVPNLQQLRNLVRLELCEIPYSFMIEPVLEFIRVHDATHHTLKEIKIKGNEDLGRHLQSTHTQLVRIVQAMRTPQVVDARHWREAILVIDQIPVDCLRTLLLGMADMPPSYISVSDYLALCPVLEAIRMPVRDERLFAWATKTRTTTEATTTRSDNYFGVDMMDRHIAGGSIARSRSLPPPVGSAIPSDSRYLSLVSNSLSPPLFAPSLWTAAGAGAAASASTTSLSSPWQSKPQQYQNHPYHQQYNYQGYSEYQDVNGPSEGQARLKSIELCGEDRCLIPALRDALDAFRDSLEHLKAQSLALMMTTVPVLNFMTLTWSWPMTRLTVLDLEGEVASAFDLSALRHCPELTTLRLSLPPYMYSSSEDEALFVEMAARMSQICLATRLLDLELQGKWPVSDTVLAMMAAQMRRLTRLWIVSCLGYTIEGVEIVGSGLERLESLAINKWLGVHPPMRARLNAVKARNPRLDLVEE